jgi:hypothetical protein
VLRAVFVQVVVLWVVAPCNLVAACQHFGGTSCLCLQGSVLNIDVAYSTEVSVYTHKTVERYDPGEPTADCLYLNYECMQFNVLVRLLHV